MELETSPVSRASYRLVPVEMAVQEEQIKQGFYEVEYFTVGSTKYCYDKGSLKFSGIIRVWKYILTH